MFSPWGIFIACFCNGVVSVFKQQLISKDTDLTNEKGYSVTSCLHGFNKSSLNRSVTSLKMRRKIKEK